MDTLMDLYGLSSVELVRLLGRRIHEYRIASDLTQKEVAAQTGISILTIQKFEAGQSDNVTLRTFLQILKAIGRIQFIDDVVPDMPQSLYQLTSAGAIKQRIKHKKS